jgi:hypothetical protein
MAEAEDILSDDDLSAMFTDSLHSDVSEAFTGAPVSEADQLPAAMQVTDPSQILITTVDSPAIVDHTAEVAYTEEDVEAAMCLFLETGEYPPANLFTAVRALLRNRVMAAIVREDYDEASLLKEAELKLSTDGIEERKQTEEHKLMLQSIEERIATVSQKLTETRANWLQKMEEFDSAKIARLDEMKTRHENELADLETQWSEPSTLLAFSKPSTQLMLIRKQQRLSALASEFARAKELKRRGDDLERVETAEAERKATESMKAVHRNLKKRQQKEIAHAQMNWKRQWQTLESERDAEIQPIELCLKQLDAKRADFIAAKIRVVPVVSIPNTGTATTGLRIWKKTSHGRCEVEQEKLALMGLRGRSRVARKEQHPRNKVSYHRSEL